MASTAAIANRVPLAQVTQPRHLSAPSVPHSAALNLDDYRVARELDRRPLAADQVDFLKVADKVLHETTAELSYGRGNVREDVERTAGGAYRRTQLARLIAGELISGRWAYAAPVPSHVAIAAAASYAKAGNCGEYTHLSIHKALSYYQPKDVIRCNNVGEKHAWMEWQRPMASQASRVSTVVVDGYMLPTPLLKEDTVYASPLLPKNENYAYNEKSLADAYRELFIAVSKNAASNLPQLSDLRREARALPLPEKYHQPESIVEEHFHDRVSLVLANTTPANPAQLSPKSASLIVAKQNGCTSEERCKRSAETLLEHLQQTW